MPIVMIVSQFQVAQTLVVDLKVSVALEKKKNSRAYLGTPLFQILDPPLGWHPLTNLGE